MVSIQLVSLAALCVHYSSLTVLMHLSRTTQRSTTYRASSAVVMTELSKLVISLVVALYDSYHHTLPATPRPSPRARFEPQFEDVTEEEDGAREDEDDDGQHGAGTEALAEGGRRTAPREEELISATPVRRDRTISSEAYMPSNQTGQRRRLVSGNGTTTSPEQPAFPSASPDHSHRMSVQASPSLSHLPRSLIPPLAARLPLALRLLHATIFAHDWPLLAIPAILFVLQNNLQYLAATHLSVPLFQISYQLKILTTALCSVVLLKRRLKTTQWASLLILAAGVAIVQLSSQPTSSRPAKTQELLSGGSGSMAEGDGRRGINQLVGLGAVVAACVSSGFASVYLERLFKSTGVETSSGHDGSTSQAKKGGWRLYPPSVAGVPQQTPRMMPSPSIWVRNIQLSGFGLAVSIAIVLLEHRLHNALPSLAACVRFLRNRRPVHLAPPPMPPVPLDPAPTFFAGFSPLTWLVILFQVSGGFLNSVVMKYSNNINKNFAICLSIILSILLSRLLRDHPPAQNPLHPPHNLPPASPFNSLFFLGTALVLFSTWLFNL